MNRAEQILQVMARLRPGTTICPGKLARDLGTTLAQLRPELGRLAETGLLSVWQRGRPAAWTGLRGPFRVGPGAVLGTARPRGASLDSQPQGADTFAEGVELAFGDGQQGFTDAPAVAAGTVGEQGGGGGIPAVDETGGFTQV